METESASPEKNQNKSMEDSLLDSQGLLNIFFILMFFNIMKLPVEDNSCCSW